MTEFLAMGGYALYVWSSYVVALGILGMVGIRAFTRARTRRADLKIMQAQLDAERDRA